MMSPMKEGSCGVMVEGLSGLDGWLFVFEVVEGGESSPSSSSERSRMKRSARADIVVVVVVVGVRMK